MGRHLLHFVTTMRDSSGHNNGSIGMLFVVLVIIIVLGLLAGLLARVCGGQHFAGHIEYDFEGWIEKRCASCIDGSLPPPPPAPPKEDKEQPKPAPSEETKTDGGDKKADVAVAQEKKEEPKTADISEENKS